MHDISDLERRGTPSVFVATTEFEDAADAQGRAIGFDAAAVYVAHPIQDRTDSEVAALADGAIGSLMDAITQD